MFISIKKVKELDPRRLLKLYLTRAAVRRMFLVFFAIAITAAILCPGFSYPLDVRIVGYIIWVLLGSSCTVLLVHFVTNRRVYKEEYIVGSEIHKRLQIMTLHKSQITWETWHGDENTTERIESYTEITIVKKSSSVFSDHFTVSLGFREEELYGSDQKLKEARAIDYQFSGNFMRPSKKTHVVVKIEDVVGKFIVIEGEDPKLSRRASFLDNLIFARELVWPSKGYDLVRRLMNYPDVNELRKLERELQIKQSYRTSDYETE